MRYMGESTKHDFRHWMDNFPLPDECGGGSAWGLFYTLGYPFDDWFLDGVPDEDIIATLRTGFADENHDDDQWFEPYDGD
jgi:hypothetical protein